MIDAPEPLRLAFRIGAFEPGQPESARLEGAVGVAGEEVFDFGFGGLEITNNCVSIHRRSNCVCAYMGLYSFQHLPRSGFPQRLLQNGHETLRLPDVRVPLDPERVVQRVQAGDEVVRR